MLDSKYQNLQKIPILFALLSIVFYTSFAYDLVRTDFTKLLTLYSALFFLCYKLIQLNKGNFRFLVAVTLLVRLVFLFAIPNLSQDFYRFIWDGRMIINGMNPYLFTPESFMNANNLPFAQARELYHGMGILNASHYTNYPPIKQFIFAIAALFSGNSILGSTVVFRFFIIAADFGTLYFGKKLLERFKLPVHSIFWYLLNPFIIIELTGSLHFEGIMIFFLVWSLYLLHSGKWKIAAVVFALSISVKLIPLMLLPLFYQWFRKTYSGLKELIRFYLIVATCTVLLFLPFYSSEFVTNYSETVALWFGQFEFNASLYYVARAIGYAITGYNQIAIIGKFIPAIVIISLIAMTFSRKNESIPKLISAMLLIATLYYFSSTTIHPWYIATLVGLSVFTNYKFPLVWSFMIIFSYYAYSNANFTENLWIVGLEYSVVYAVFIWEVFFKKVNSQKLDLNLQNT